MSKTYEGSELGTMLIYQNEKEVGGAHIEVQF